MTCCLICWSSKSFNWSEAFSCSHILTLHALILDIFLLWCFSTLIFFTHALTHVLFTFVCFLELLLTQLHADFCADLSSCLNLVTETVIYRKLLSKASTEFSKISKLIAVIISFYFMFVCCQFTSFTIFLQSLLQLFIILVSLSVQFVVKLEFNSLILFICCSQFRELITIISQIIYNRKLDILRVKWLVHIQFLIISIIQLLYLINVNAQCFICKLCMLNTELNSSYAQASL